MTTPQPIDPQAAARAQASRRAQGLPDHIEDPVVLERVARLLTETSRSSPAGQAAA
jgi:hypothetical protein